MKQPNRMTTLGVSGHSSHSSTVAEDMDTAVTMDLLPLHRFRNTRLKTRPSRHPTNTKLAHPNTVVRRLHSLRALTHLTETAPLHLHSRTVITRIMAQARTNTTVAPVVAAVADVEVHGVAVVTLALLPVRQLSCKT
jgi:hypothetical protein